ncbi:hypothetical protein Q7A53_17265 [Halobacillus rhizosphaerae]|uniref:hypothetical protein n=1 Tax=Halobacillus rhizosphaerae TaxID=3064889 RepID=UPI00398AAAFF
MRSHRAICPRKLTGRLWEVNKCGIDPIDTTRISRNIKWDVIFHSVDVPAYEASVWTMQLSESFPRPRLAFKSKGNLQELGLLWNKELSICV